jgi:RND family efflux transporter MFP subunit
MRMRTWQTAAAVGLSIGLCAGSLAQTEGGTKAGWQPTATARAAAEFGGEQCFTRASRAATLGFTFPVEIAEVKVRGGQRVKAGDLLVRARDEDVVAQRDLQKILADTGLEIARTKATLDQAEVELSAQEQLKERNRGTAPIEYDRAKATVEVRRAEYELAKLQQTQQKLTLVAREAQLERYRIRAPFDGIVDSVAVDAGDVKRETDAVLRLVATEPLWMDVPTPTSLTLTLGLKAGDAAWVLLDTPGEPDVRVGRVIEVGAEADPGSSTRRVRVEVANPAGLPSGITAWVRFSEPSAEWKQRVAARGDAKNEAGSVSR